MTNLFLKAKHWQLFILIFVIPMLVQFALFGMIASSFGDGDGNDYNKSYELIALVFKVIPIMTIFFSVIYFGWFWSVAVGLDKEIPEELKLNLGRFKASSIFAFSYLVLIMAVMSFIFPALLTMLGVPPAIFGVVFILHLLAMFCMFYNLYFVAKTIKTAETQKAVSFGDFVGEFFMLWFFPVGVWILQPLINKLVSKEDDFL